MKLTDKAYKVIILMSKIIEERLTKWMKIQTLLLDIEI